MTLSHVTLILGGARSGKSRKAEELAETLQPPWHYIATAEAYDDEMQARIKMHQARRGANWMTHEAPIAIPEEIGSIPLDAPLLIDCLTLWLTNLILAGRNVETATEALKEALGARTGQVFVVSNETGLGIVPDNELARTFRDAQGHLNQDIAAVAGKVIFMVAGLPMTVK